MLICKYLSYIVDHHVIFQTLGNQLLIGLNLPYQPSNKNIIAYSIFQIKLRDCSYFGILV